MQMEASSEKKKNLELLQFAVDRIVDQRNRKEGSGESFVEDDDDRLLLSKLLSQLESLKGDDSILQPLATTDQNKLAPADDKAGKKLEKAGEDDDDEIIKELKKVRKQNSVTHWLISIMIVLTVTWQLSEVSLVMRVKDRVSHPFRSFGGMLAGLLQMKGPDPNPSKVLDDKKHSKPLHIETPSLPHLTMPELPHMELPDLGLHDRKE